MYKLSKSPARLWDGNDACALGRAELGAGSQLTQLKAPTPNFTGAWWAAIGISESPRGKCPSLAVPCPLGPSSIEEDSLPRNFLLPIISPMPQPTQPAGVS